MISEVELIGDSTIAGAQCLSSGQMARWERIQKMERKGGVIIHLFESSLMQLTYIMSESSWKPVKLRRKDSGAHAHKRLSSSRGAAASGLLRNTQRARINTACISAASTVRLKVV